jgi:hypothetical protein
VIVVLGKFGHAVRARENGPLLSSIGETRILRQVSS